MSMFLVLLTILIYSPETLRVFVVTFFLRPFSTGRTIKPISLQTYSIHSYIRTGSDPFERIDVINMNVPPTTSPFPSLSPVGQVLLLLRKRSCVNGVSDA